VIVIVKGMDWIVMVHVVVIGFMMNVVYAVETENHKDIVIVTNMF